MKKIPLFKPAAISLIVMSALAPSSYAADCPADPSFRDICQGDDRLVEDFNDMSAGWTIFNGATLTANRFSADFLQVGIDDDNTGNAVVTGGTLNNITVNDGSNLNLHAVTVLSDMIVSGGRAKITDSAVAKLSKSGSGYLVGSNNEIEQLSLSGGGTSFNDSKIGNLSVTSGGRFIGTGNKIDSLSVDSGGDITLREGGISSSIDIGRESSLSLINTYVSELISEISFNPDASQLNITNSQLITSITTTGTGGTGEGKVVLSDVLMRSPEGNRDVLRVRSGDKVSLIVSDSSRVDGNVTAEQAGIADATIYGGLLRGTLNGVNQFTVTKDGMMEMTADSDVAVLQMGNLEVRAGGTIRLSDTFTGVDRFHTLTAGELTGSGHFIMRTDVASDRADLLQVTGNATGSHLLYVTNTGAEPGRPAWLLPLVTIGSGDAAFSLAEGKVDVGAWQYVLVRSGNSWGLMRPGDGVIVTPIPGNPEEPGNPVNPGEPGNPEEPGNPVNPGEPDGPTTTPSTDAVLSLASALKEMYFGELRSLNARGSRVNAGLNDGVWGSYTSNHVNVQGAWNSAYRLNQNGFILGADRQFGFNAGRLTTGLFVSNSTGTVKHARGGKSNIDTWSTGFYARHDFNGGWYASALAKVNRFDTSLSAEMTDGTGVSGEWRTWGYGAGTEVGRKLLMQGGLTVTPYASLNGYQNGNETARLSNGLKADFGNSRSLRGEAGVRAEKSFSIAKGELAPYVTAALVQEFARSSDIRINDTWNFNNDFTGSGAKVAAGVSLNVGAATSLWVEAATAAAERTKMPVQASAGIRYSF